MRFSAVLASAVAVKLHDAPAYFNEPTWNERMPSASGFVQLSASACANAGAAGVSCVPDAMLFATGMNGDEDLGQDIQMKGEPFHYKQQSFAQAGPVAGDGSNLGPGKFDGTTFQHLEVATAPGDLPVCTGTNGPVGVNCQREGCTGTNGPMDGPASTGCIRAEPDDIPHYNEDPTAGRPYQTTGDQQETEVVPAPSPYGLPNDPSQFGDQNGDSSRHVDADYADSVSDQASISAYYVQTADEDAAAEEEKKEVPPPEKVSVLETPIAKSHTTFYPQGKH